MNPDWTVAALGSCRVHTPLTHAAAEGWIEFKTDPTIGFLHNPLELDQAISLLRGERTAPAELSTLMSIVLPEKLGKEDLFDRLFFNMDLLVVEISSLRIIEYDGWYLQLHRFRELIADENFSERELSGMFRPGSPTRERLRRRARSELAADILWRGIFYEMSAEELDASLAELRGTLGVPTLFVGTVTHDWSGNPIPQRVMLRDALARCAAKMEGTCFLDPTRFIAPRGVGHWMKDLGHYKPEHEAEVGRQLVGAMRRFARSCEAIPRRRMKRRMREERAAERLAQMTGG